ncbi:MAG TPA: HAD family phosphatase [Phycisphaerae bacterium]|nr:HAD family phosphatase [Phycisphaerae bacterium]
MNEFAAIFDMDGVLVDSYWPHYQAWKEMAKRYDLPITEERFATAFGKTGHDFVKELWGDIIKEQDIPALDAEKEELYREVLRADFPAMKGVCDLIKSLHDDGYALAIGSSGAPANIQVVLECLPNAEMFAATVNGFEVTKGKPDPDIFLTAAGKLGVEPRNAAVIEDSPVGIEAAKAAGMVAVAITGTAERKNLAEANIIVDWMMELSPQLISLLIENNRRKG